MSAEEVTLTPLPEGKAQKRTEALDEAERDHGAKEARTMVEGLKDLFRSSPEVLGPEQGLTAQNTPVLQQPDRRVENLGLGLREGPVHLPTATRRITDPEFLDKRTVTGILDAQAKEELRASGLAPGPWDGVPAAIQVLMPLGRYDRVTDDAWRLVKAFCEARAQEPDRQDPTRYNRIQDPEGQDHG